MPKYEEIANTLRNRIKNDTYPAGSLLPKQIELVKEFSVSRMTVQKALEILTLEGLLASKKGVGTTILNHPFLTKDTSVLSYYEGLSTEMEKANRKLESKVIEFNVEFPDAAIQEKLHISEEEPVYKIIRLRILDDKPFILEHTYMPIQAVPNLKKEIIESSIYQYIKKELAIKITGAYRTIRADKSSEYDQTYLDCAADDPVLEIRQIAYQQNGDPIEYSRSRNRFDVRDYSYLDMKGN
ncbi:GntR family transcriptional regulator [Enterococcus malodoratus]|uniref:GntR family transcriptional regulator n=1 Tax=Enterococcus malodoratus TaxID=71451 RepID=UPI0008AEF885|nr:GntR family transcriptional regulator [Enterococcus malodoratus]SES71153.1 GntR family transcriptional regulator [Enterococcus malodoratus]